MKVLNHVAVGSQCFVLNDRRKPLNSTPLKLAEGREVRAASLPAGENQVRVRSVTRWAASLPAGENKVRVRSVTHWAASLFFWSGDWLNTGSSLVKLLDIFHFLVT